MTDFGESLKSWRAKRRLSQLALSLEAEVSNRHLSFLETGRARPSRDMIGRLADALDLPLFARNALLAQAGFAAQHAERDWDDAEMAPEVEGALIMRKKLVREKRKRLVWSVTYCVAC